MAAELSRVRRLDIRFLEANICEMPFLENSFDLIWCCSVLQHLLSSERKLAVEEFSRILREGGTLFVRVFGRDDMRYGGCRIEPDTFSRKNGVIYHYFDKAELEDLLKGFSCEIVESRKEKRFEGKSYIRHTISVEAKKL